VLETLTPGQLANSVTIRGEVHPVVSALDRQLAHHAYHVGQIVLLAKHYAGEKWETLSVPRGRSEAFTVDVQARAANPAR